jgi:ribokinase
MFGTGSVLEIRDPGGLKLTIDLPPDWPGPAGAIQLARPIRMGAHGSRQLRGVAWQDDLGGMGAGYAAALGGILHCALGSESDQTSQVISRLIARYGIPHEPMRVADRPGDWTLLITSGEFGDKLPIGFRGCHAALEPDVLEARTAQRCDLRVVAALPNRLAARALSAPGAAARLFAPTLRNMLDRACTISSFAASVDVFACNRGEWEMLDDREEVAWQVSILVITEGADGSAVRFTTPTGESARLRVPAFPRARPPRDTNRAGEAFAATLIAALLEGGWHATSGVIDEDLIGRAAKRASAASALTLDLVDFGFPSPAEVDTALDAGRVV